MRRGAHRWIGYAMLLFTTAHPISSFFIPFTRPTISVRMTTTNDNNDDDTTTAATTTTFPLPPSDATTILTQHDALVFQKTSNENSQGLGGGTTASEFLETLSSEERERLRRAVLSISHHAANERDDPQKEGRVMLGICAEDSSQALAALKSWVGSLKLPRGLLHGMDVDGVPMSTEELGSVYIKYSTGGVMTFTEMRNSGLGFDALWKPGDALLEPYDGDFRGVYFNVELSDGVFRQFGILPLDLFSED